MTLQIAGIGKAFGAVKALENISLEIADGEFLCLLGPSGCGKTTLLRIIAGLEQASAGQLHLDGENLTDVPAHRRNFGMVFQSLALFPHLTVAENVGYGLKIAGRRASECRQRVDELLELVQLPDFGRRSVSTLSGGQRQRVAIARALAIQPRLFLLDEPLSALDAGLRETMQIELRELQQRLGITTIVVTHDQREAMTVADRIAVMHDGKLIQVDTPTRIYRQPANRLVARFIGQTNLLPLEAVEDELICPGTSLRWSFDGRVGSSADPPAWLSVRPESLSIVESRETRVGEEQPRGEAGTVEQAGSATMQERCKTDDSRVTARLRFVRDLGAQVELHLELPAQSGRETIALIALSNHRQSRSLETGSEVVLHIPKNDAVLLPA